LELSLRLHEKTHRFLVLSGAWVFHIVRGNLERSREHAAQAFDLASEEGIPAFAMAGHFVMGSTLFHLGKFSESEAHLRRALSLWGGSTHPALALFAGPDLGVFCHSYIAHVLWHLGAADLSRASSEEAVTCARRLANPIALAIALNYAAMLHAFRRDPDAVRRYAEEASEVCRDHAFAYYLSMAEILAGWAMAELSAPAEGMGRLRRGLEALRATGAELRLPFYHGLLAEACARAGLHGEALANVSNGFAFLNKNGEAWAAAGLQRVYNDLLVQNPTAKRPQTAR
jgi:predicted ATPase